MRNISFNLYVHLVLSYVDHPPPTLMVDFLVAPFFAIYAAAEENNGFTMRLREVKGSRVKIGKINIW